MIGFKIKGICPVKNETSVELKYQILRAFNN